MNHKFPTLFKFYRWRLRHLSDRKLVLILSPIIGVCTALGATVIKKSVKWIQYLVDFFTGNEALNYLYVFLPFIGILIVVLIVKFIIRSPVRHGIPNVLHSISCRKGELSKHNLYSSILTSVLTVGFGGSVGLEGPAVATGAAYGSWFSNAFRLDYRYKILMLACASSGAMAAIFKAPITGIAFAIEIVMIDVNTFSLVPLLLTILSSIITSYFFMGDEALYPFKVTSSFLISDFPMYVVFGILAGLFSAYFTKIFIWISDFFEKIKSVWSRLCIGGFSLGIIIFFFPSLYGEGYHSINSCIHGNIDYLFNNSLFFNVNDSFPIMVLLILAICFLKVIATSITFGAGGVGGIFAPALFTGANMGMFFALICDKFNIFQTDKNNLVLIGMSGMIAGILQAPLTGIFLIAEITGGYSLFVPLMIVSLFSYLTVKIFATNSVYHYQLAQRKELMTHDQDTNVLRMMEVNKLVETDFISLHPEDNLGKLAEVISISHRNLFPIVDENGNMKGMLKMDDVREIIFRSELYDKVFMKDLMYMPEYFISTNDTMKDVVKKFGKSGRYNIAVIDNGKYVGFISRARVFSRYRKEMSLFSHD